MPLNITDACRDSIMEHGIVWRDGVPAGQELLNAPRLRVALVENDLPASVIDEELKSHLASKEYPAKILGPAAFPEGTQDAVRKAIGYWYSGEIEFVGAGEEADLHIVAVDYSQIFIAGVASFPINDNPDYPSLSHPVILVNTPVIQRAEKPDDPATSALRGVENIVRHEFGHTIGVTHPVLGGIDGTPNLPIDVCQRDELKYLNGEQNDSVMRNTVSAAPQEGEGPSSYDEFVRDAVKGPVP